MARVRFGPEAGRVWARQNGYWTCSALDQLGGTCRTIHMRVSDLESGPERTCEPSIQSGVTTLPAYSLSADSDAGMLADEQRANAFIEQDAAAYANAVNRASSAPRQRSIRIRKRAKFHGIALPPTPGNKEATHVGAHLLMAMCQSTGAFTIDRRLDYTKRPPRPSLVLTPTVATLEWIATRSDRLRLTMPIHPPTLIPPRDWSQSEPGGYHPMRWRGRCP